MRQDRSGRLRRGGDQQAATGLGIAEQVPPPELQVFGAPDVGAVAVPVAHTGTGPHALPGQGLCAGQEPGRQGVDLKGQARPPGHFQPMPQEAKAGDVSHGMDAIHSRKVRSRRIEPGGRAHQGGIAGGVQPALLEGRRQHAHAQGLAEDQFIPRPGGAIGHDKVGMDQAQGH